MAGSGGVVGGVDRRRGEAATVARGEEGARWAALAPGTAGSKRCREGKQQEELGGEGIGAAWSSWRRGGSKVQGGGGR